jgi:hypothetical protein
MRRNLMTKHLLALAAATSLLAGAATGALAQSSLTPGKQFQENGSISGSAGASGYAPGQQFRSQGSVKGTTGASGYAPGQLNSDNSAGADARLKAGGVKARGNVGAGVNGNVKVK